MANCRMDKVIERLGHKVKFSDIGAVIYGGEDFNEEIRKYAFKSGQLFSFRVSRLMHLKKI